MVLKEFAKDVASRINSFMESYINKFDDDAQELKESMRYGLLLGGKRARPLLVYATGLALGQSIEKLDYAAAAIECVHAYSLIRDDMPGNGQRQITSWSRYSACKIFSDCSFISR